MTTLVWFRDDVRLHDHPALYAASLQNQALRAIYFVTPEQWQRQHMAPIKADLLERQLNILGEELARHGIPLNVIHVPAYADIPARLLEYCQIWHVQNLYANRDVGIYEQQRDVAVSSLLRDHQIATSWLDARCVFPPGSVLTQKQEMFKVYTPFRNTWLKLLQQQSFTVWPQPATILPPCRWTPCHLEYAKQSSQAWMVGEPDVLAQLHSYCEERVRGYANYRDVPALNYTSRLSPYLALGIVSVRQCLSVLQETLGHIPFEEGAAGFAWLNELIWREFYTHLMVAFPHLSKNQAFKQDTDHIRWHQNPDSAHFKAWCDGMTGYPIVDAAMRCLNQTGWMHNRLRMIVASFLTKDLQIDWRLGERYFMEHLIDGDFPSNNGGWQWAASTGADAVPYFRIFNPVTQGEKFDPDGKFVRQWLPELLSVPAEHIQAPHAWLARHQPRSPYPQPVVDHAEARKRTLALFKEAEPVR
jgi:deoxyribodipyrimidine photo-lyase